MIRCLFQRSGFQFEVIAQFRSGKVEVCCGRAGHDGWERKNPSNGGNMTSDVGEAGGKANMYVYLASLVFL